jgi:hypothetical protein
VKTTYCSSRSVKSMSSTLPDMMGSKLERVVAESWLLGVSGDWLQSVVCRPGPSFELPCPPNSRAARSAAPTGHSLRSPPQLMSEPLCSLSEPLQTMATPALSNHVPTSSPLKQVNATPAKPVPLFDSQWAELTANPSLLANKSTLETTRYFQDLFCLKPNGGVLSVAFAKLSTEQVVREYKVSRMVMSERRGLGGCLHPRLTIVSPSDWQNNVTLFFTNAVKVLKETDRGDIRRANVVEVS